MKLDVVELAKAFPAAYFKRGEAYFWDGAVAQCEVVSDGSAMLTLKGRVEGSLGSYQQKVILFSHGKKVKVQASCSCPVGRNCKHVVAVCLAYMRQRTQQSGALNQEALAWVDDFSQSFHEPLVAAIPDEGDFVAYILHQVRGTVRIQIHKTRCLKRGGLSKGKHISVYEAVDWVNYYPAHYVQDEDVEIIKVLSPFLRGMYFELREQSGALALRKMLLSGRCFWENFERDPLKLGEPREFVCEWKADMQGSVTLNMSIKPEALLIPTDPAMYCDPKHGEVGVFNAMPYTSKQLNMLREAPVIPASLVDEFSQKLALSVPPEVLEPPKEVEVLHVEGETPRPCLFFRKVETLTGMKRVACLRFDYQGHIISVFPCEEHTRLLQEQQVVVIQRDMDAEARAQSILHYYGMTSGTLGDSGDLYCVVAGESELEYLTAWLSFLSDVVPQLQADGWYVDVDDDFHVDVYDAGAWYADIEETEHDWFDLSFDIEINQEKRPLLPLVTQVLEHYDLENLPDMLVVHLEGEQYVKMPAEHIKPILKVLYELYDTESQLVDSHLKMSRFDAASLADLEQEHQALQWQGGENLRALGQRLKDFSGIQAVEPPRGLHAELRVYQQEGLNWLQFLRSYQLNGILADDMGLGKTVQTLAHLLVEKEQGRLQAPCLIVAPTSLMSNWKREAAVFAPALKVLVLQGGERKQHFESMMGYDVLLSTYPLLVRDEEVLKQHAYHMLVLDEAQVIKNPKSKAAKVARQLKAQHRLCLTGTPMENHLGELWALFDFLMPGFLGHAKQFNSLFRTPIEKHGDTERQQALVRRIKPFMLRRSKQEVAGELPEKTEITRMVSLGKKQAALYESIRLAMEEKVRKSIASKGLAKSHIVILDALLKLRQVCCDPRILSLKQAKKLEESAKLAMLMEMLPEMLEEGRRILIFSQFTQMLSLIEKEITAQHISYSKLTGQTRKRDAAIEKFKQGKADVFLISLKAGGVGLNLTEADTVIHYDPWWNPAAENQATDRAHRIGQDKAVFVYKLVVENSVEEKILTMQAKKQALASAVYRAGEDKKGVMLTTDDMEVLFAPLT